MSFDNLFFDLYCLLMMCRLLCLTSCYIFIAYLWWFDTTIIMLGNRSIPLYPKNNKKKVYCSKWLQQKKLNRRIRASSRASHISVKGAQACLKMSRDVFRPWFSLSHLSFVIEIVSRAENTVSNIMVLAPEIAGLPARVTGTNLLPELRYKSSAHWQNRLVQVLTGNPLSPVFRNELFILVNRTYSTRSKIIYFWHSCALKEYTVFF